MAANGCWSDGWPESLLRKLHGSLRGTVTASTALRGRRALLSKCQFATRSRPHALKMYWKRNQHRLRAHGIVTRPANAHGIPRNRLSL